jgi:uncharacterized protein YerC
MTSHSNPKTVIIEMIMAGKDNIEIHKATGINKSRIFSVRKMVNAIGDTYYSSRKNEPRSGSKRHNVFVMLKERTDLKRIEIARACDVSPSTVTKVYDAYIKK